ncbi:hypothetical protein ACFFU1_13170 [Algibacter miyuki]|uniref:Protein TsetseEP domain-containing protein n=1 Tax=Algibacter miyuki TaxID=1306933 RepID=A0ABV5H1T0_9FLAO|nr:hypothetical protein [Algibacter miyuki]MDN3666464.1 hypothetical protein [Algibacter miyuki]
MKTYVLLTALFTTLISNSQAACDDANAYLVNAYSHIKDSYDSNNISHLKYYANRSLESIELAKENLEGCDCQTAVDLAGETVDLLLKVENQPTFEDGRFYVKRARELSQKSVIASDKCTAGITNNGNNDVLDDDNTLAELQNEQLKLKQQQEALKLKEAELKMKLSAQKDKALRLEKKQLISGYNLTITENIKTFNKTLMHCGNANTVLKSPAIEVGLADNDMDAINVYFIKILKTLTSEYATALNACGN